MKTPHDLTQEILRRVCAKYRIKLNELLGEGRHLSYIKARRSAIKALHEAHPDWSLSRIARAVNRDRTTISYHLGRRPSALRHARASL